jgi:flagella basal body P-ring formation protein FlgA
LQIALRLEGVNIASVSFSGAARCTLHRAADRPAAEAQDLAVPAEKATAAGIEEKASAAAEAKSQAGPTNAGAAIPAGADLPVAPAKTAPLATVASHLQEQLLEQLAARPEEMTLSIAPASRPTAEMVWPAPASITSTDRNILGRRTWRVDYQQNGRPCQRYITGIVHLVRPAVIARRALASGLTLTAGDVECVLREDDGRQERLATLESVVGQQVRRPLAEGQTIAPGDLKSPVLVIRGQLAWVQAGFVQVRAKALGQGAGGEVVEFENVQSKGHVWAQVTGPGTAQVTSAPTQ